MSAERIIFFDLETSSLHRVGQILNFCFTCVDRQWRTLDCLKGDVKLCRLQLPEPESIASTGIDILSQDLKARFTETQAMLAIEQFFCKWNIKDSTLIAGYNSESFDIPFLRTSFLRSGVYPYCHPRSTDLMVLVKYLFSQNSELRNRYREYLSEVTREAEPAFSVRLEFVANFFGLLNRPQAHESEDDVRVTIALAKKIEDDFGLSIFCHCPYQIFSLHEKPGGIPERLVQPGRCFSSGQSVSDFVLLRVENKASYWIDMAAFDKWLELPYEEKSKKLPIKRFKFCETNILCDSQYIPSDEEAQKARTAYNLLKSFSVDDLFQPKKCCIEQWMYRLAPLQVKDLQHALKNPQSERKLSFTEDQNFLWRRYFLANMSEQKLQTKWTAFQDYCHYRYGKDGRRSMRLYEDYEKDRNQYGSPLHPSYIQLKSELVRVKENLLTKNGKYKFYSSDQVQSKLHALTQLDSHYDKSAVRRALS